MIAPRLPGRLLGACRRITAAWMRVRAALGDGWRVVAFYSAMPNPTLTLALALTLTVPAPPRGQRGRPRCALRTWNLRRGAAR